MAVRMDTRRNEARRREPWRGAVRCRSERRDGQGEGERERERRAGASERANERGRDTRQLSGARVPLFPQTVAPNATHLSRPIVPFSNLHPGSRLSLSFLRTLPVNLRSFFLATFPRRPADAARYVADTLLTNRLAFISRSRDTPRFFFLSY